MLLALTMSSPLLSERHVSLIRRYKNSNTHGNRTAIVQLLELQASNVIMEMADLKDRVAGSILGVFIGDALGVGDGVQ
jgi:hypothetical protein